MSKSTIPLGALLTVAAAVGLTSAGPAAATYNDTSAGGACHVANGGAEKQFTYSNNYLTNTGTTDQYVICHFAMEDASAPAAALIDLKVHAGSGASPGTVTCVGQYGSFYAGSNHIESTQSKNVSLGAGSNGEMDFTPTFTRTPVYNTFTLNCRVPAGFKLGLIEYWEG